MGRGQNETKKAAIAAASVIPIYHEKQTRQLCCLHVLNNLFQKPEFTKSDLDLTCSELSPESYSWWNPHRSCVGLGNYDVNVLIASLQTRHCTAEWFDRRKDAACLNLDNIIGFVFNCPSESKFFPLWPFSSRRHWYAVREIADCGFFNLDSKLNEPDLIGDRPAMITYINKLNASSDVQLFVIVTQPVADERSFLLF